MNIDFSSGNIAGAWIVAIIAASGGEPVSSAVGVTLGALAYIALKVYLQ